MPRSQLTKIDVESKVYKLKNHLYNGYKEKSGDWHEGANHTLNQVLEILNEFRY